MYSQAVADLAPRILLRTLMQLMILCSLRRVHQGHTKLGLLTVNRLTGP